MSGVVIQTGCYVVQAKSYGDAPECYVAVHIPARCIAKLASVLQKCILCTTYVGGIPTMLNSYLALFTKLSRVFCHTR